MLNSVVITVSIARPYAEVYSFCADPMNFGRWNLLPDGLMEALGGNEYLVDLPQGQRVMRFMPFGAHARQPRLCVCRLCCPPDCGGICGGTTKTELAQARRRGDWQPHPRHSEEDETDGSFLAIRL
jgi:hypothetical protein